MVSFVVNYTHLGCGIAHLITGETWKLESKAWSYVGNFPDAVGVPGKS